MMTKCTSGQSFFFLDNSGFGQNYTKELRKIDGNENAAFQVLPIPENSLGERRAVSYNTRFDRLYAINVNAKNKDQIIKFIDWMYSMEASTLRTTVSRVRLSSTMQTVRQNIFPIM